MEFKAGPLIITFINFALLFAVIIFIYKAVQVVKKHITRNKEMSDKIGIILEKLQNEKK